MAVIKRAAWSAHRAGEGLRGARALETLALAVVVSDINDAVVPATLKLWFTSLDGHIYTAYICFVGKTKLTQKLILLEPEKAALLAELAEDTGLLQSVLMRKAIDQLLVRYGKLEAPKRRTRK
jgi:hypothetical protein